MAYDVFLQLILQAVSHLFGSDYLISLEQVRKNNGVLLQGLNIWHKNSFIGSTIYMEAFYQQYLNHIPIEHLAEDIFQLFHENAVSEDLMENTFSDFSSASKALAYKLIHTGDNKELLKNLPHIPFLDLSITFYLALHTNDHFYSSLITTSQMDHWHLTVQDLFQTAHYNTPLLFPYQLNTMDHLLTQMANVSESEDCEQLVDNIIKQCRKERPAMYVLTNMCETFGACCLLYPGILNSLACSIGTDLIILPSSIHEVLLLPDNGKSSYQALNHMVTEVNAGEVAREEWLSDHIYLYSRHSDSIYMPSGICARLP